MIRTISSILSKLGGAVILFTLLNILLFGLTACDIWGNKSIGELEDVEVYMNSKTKDKVTDIEMTNIEIIPQRIDSHQFILDGTTFYDGEDETIPEHHIKTFRAFSEKLDSYVFLTFNEYTQKYTMVQNYDNSEEKQEAFELTNKIQDIMQSNHITIETLQYSKFSNETTELNDVYKLSDQYDVSSYSLQSRLWVMVSVDSSADDIRNIKNIIQTSINTTENYISMEIKTGDNRKITFFKDGQPLIYDKNGFQIDL